MDTYLETVQLSERHFGLLEKASVVLNCEMVGGGCQTQFSGFVNFLEVARVTALRSRQPIKESKSCGS
jgi:hypothetical protein